MKRILISAVILSMFVFLLLCPSQALAASRDGMKLWLNTLLPTLLPFLILTGVLVHTEGIEKLFSPLAPFWRFFFGLSPSGAYALILGLLCGYPMGAKMASDLYTHGKICEREAEYLLTFTNNASPAFLTTYVTHVCLRDAVSPGRAAGVLFLSNGIVMLFFRFLVFHNRTATELPRISKENGLPPKKETSPASSLGTVLDVSIMNGFETIARLGGYILLFSILTAGIRHMIRISSAPGFLILGSLELTTGLHLLTGSGLPFSFLYPASLMLTAFGGCCILAQTKSVISRDLSFRPYFSAKCLNACVTGGILLFF